ncbi:prohibitin family protein [Ideonella azotifigens]|uniref:Band 7 domain-containing protein n=2 Tax=Ideonella azotifigens TaxID=513160 RepID=A0ABN1JTE0_9BURK|nr:SPFH domain-containing protein [Ideonella azotifigens]MCD2341018.1 prohibitin family protein [Ideonella azotifigens]
MNPRLSSLAQAVRSALSRTGRGLARVTSAGAGRVFAARTGLVLLAGIGLAGYALVKHPPVQTVAPGELAVRTNVLTGGATAASAGTVFLIPGLHELHRYPLRDQVYRPADSATANGAAPFQSVEGLSLGVDLSVRYALDPARVAAMSRDLPADLGKDVVQPAVQGVIFKVFTRYTVREIFSSRRAEIQQQIEAELRPRLAADGILLRSVQMGKVDLPPDYRAGMDRLLAEELATEKMQYTLQLKEKEVQQTALEAEAQKVRREKNAEASARETLIAAQAQEEAMKHVLPFKQKQIEQRSLEAEADKQTRIKGAEANAQARRIESQGEADSRQKLADAEVYRLQKVGQANAEQMAKEGALITRHPLLIQKTLADKLSDKIQVIIAPPPANGDFIGSALVGGMQRTAAVAPQQPQEAGEAQ